MRNLYNNNLDFDPRLLTKITEKNEGKQIHPKKEKKLKKKCFSKKITYLENIVVFTTKKMRKLEGIIGESGYRSRYFPHAKQALYHLS